MSEKQESSASLGDDYESKKKWGTGVQGEDEVGDIADSLCNLSTSGGDKNPVAMEDDEVADILCNMKMGLVNKPRNEHDDMGKADDQDREHSDQNKEKPSWSSSSSEKNDKFLVYKKSLTENDVSIRQLRIPLVFVREYLDGPSEDDEKNKVELKLIDHVNEMWVMEGSMCGLTNNCVFWSISWAEYLNKYDLKADDDIMLYHDPDPDDYDTHLLIKFQKKENLRKRKPEEADISVREEGYV